MAVDERRQTAGSGDKERFQRADELFQAALERRPEERPAFLEAACAGDADLRREVESLLAADRDDEGLLRAAVEAELTLLSEERAASLTGQRIGPYRLLRELGHGGMGAVYLAARVDEQFHQQVSIKVLRPGLDSEGILRRFLSERQILASLHHPNVARLLDGGVTAAGLPYFVMEYIEGETIDHYCDRHRLGVDERLELFCQVCSAVHYAHQNLVVHRDLKPANILVTAEGVPKLLDFGVAKLLNPELSFETITPTGLDPLRFLTPEYASPEQVTGGPITTATDVYSLGVLLYELLTGQRPHRFASYRSQELEKVLFDTDPVKPSTAVRRLEAATPGEPLTPEPLSPEQLSQRRGAQPEGLSRKLAGDLDNIVLMALRKEPQRRYASAQQLAEDIRRHLDERPVIARADTFGYRTGKFIRRHKLGVAFVALLLAFAVGMTLLSVRLLEERKRTESERARAEQVSGFMVNVFRLTDPTETSGDTTDTPGNTITAREILERATVGIEDLTDQPELQAKLMGTVAAAYRGLGLYGAARELLERALQIRRQLHGPEHLEVAESLSDLALVLSIQECTEEALPLAREALQIRRRLLGDQHLGVAKSLNLLAEVLVVEGDYRAAEALHREALEMRRELLDPDHPEVAESLNNLAWLLQDRGEYAEAQRLVRESLAVNVPVFGEFHPKAILLRNNLGAILLLEGDYEGAEPLLKSALEAYRKRLGEEHTYVAMAQNNLALALAARGEHAEAEALFRRALATHRRLSGAEHSNTAGVATNLAGLLAATGDPAAAEPLARDALEVFTRSYPAGHWRILYAQGTLGACLVASGRFAEAEPLLRESYAAVKDEHGERSLYTQTALQRLVTLYEAWGKPGQAARYRALFNQG